MGGGLSQRQVRFRAGQVGGRLDKGRVRSVHGLVQGLGDVCAAAATAAATLVLWARASGLLQHAWSVGGWAGSDAATAGFADIGGSTERSRGLVIAVNAVLHREDRLLPRKQWHWCGGWVYF